jgi:hypothetical protein
VIKKSTFKNNAKNTNAFTLPEPLTKIQTKNILPVVLKKASKVGVLFFIIKMAWFIFYTLFVLENCSCCINIF